MRVTHAGLAPRGRRDCQRFVASLQRVSLAGQITIQRRINARRRGDAVGLGAFLMGAAG
jgi:hypothetical protein